MDCHVHFYCGSCTTLSQQIAWSYQSPTLAYTHCCGASDAKPGKGHVTSLTEFTEQKHSLSVHNQRNHTFCDLTSNTITHNAKQVNHLATGH